MSAARATSAGRTSIMKTPESTELIVDTEIGQIPLDSECSKVWQSSKRFIEAISPRTEKNPANPRKDIEDSDCDSRDGEAKLRRLLGSLGHSGINVADIEPDMKRKIRRAFKMYD